MVMLRTLVVCLLIHCTTVFSHNLCEGNENSEVDYSNRKLTVVAFDTRSPGHFQNHMRLFGRRFGPGVQDIIVLGRNVSWSPLKVCNDVMKHVPMIYIASIWCSDIFVAVVTTVFWQFSFSINLCTTQDGLTKLFQSWKMLGRIRTILMQ